MSQPPVFEITVVFAAEEAGQVGGRTTVRAAALDSLMSGIKAFSDAVRTNLALIQRDDGELLDGIVKIHTLHSDVLSLISGGAFTVRGPWATLTAYVKGDLVAQGDSVYLCIEAHTSGTFATDLAASKWVLFTTTAAAGNTSFAPTDSIAAGTVQAAIEELDGELRPGIRSYMRNAYGGL